MNTPKEKKENEQPESSATPPKKPKSPKELNVVSVPSDEDIFSTPRLTDYQAKCFMRHCEGVHPEAALKKLIELFEVKKIHSSKPSRVPIIKVRNL